MGGRHLNWWFGWPRTGAISGFGVTVVANGNGVEAIVPAGDDATAMDDDLVHFHQTALAGLFCTSVLRFIACSARRRHLQC